MTKEELTEVTLNAMRLSRDESSIQGAGDDASVVLATLAERLPKGDIKTCEDLSIGVKCCETCHTLYPHYEMYLEQLPTGEIAWICCAVQSALRSAGKSGTDQDTEGIDL